MIRTCFLLALTLLGSAGAQEADSYRLPPGVVPESQSIRLDLDPAQLEYSGAVAIRLRVAEATARIGFYQKGLTLDRLRLRAGDTVRELSAENADYDRVWAGDGEPIEAGDYLLEIDFHGALASDALGLYQVAYEGRHYVYTQFEAMQARRAFPVFDEPAFKIPYQLTVTAPRGLVVLSNTPSSSVEESGDVQTVRFAATPPMSSYLIALAVGPMDRVPIKGLSVPAHIYTPAGHQAKTGFAATQTHRILEALEDYFGQPYPYRKLDFVAVPDFAFGAMENVGLVTYRAELLLTGEQPRGDEAATTVGVIAHELAHMWYGNLVTMAWWDDLWLNEAFASWMASKLGGALYPEYDTDLRLPQNRAFGADGRTAAKAIRKTVRDEDEIIDGIGLNYTKGHAILNMIERFIGPDAMRRGIRQYVTDFAWKNATDLDLWSALGAASGQDIRALAANYLAQPGYPLVSFEPMGRVRQERYRSFAQEAPDLRWRVPLNVKYRLGDEVRQTRFMLGEPEAVVPGLVEAQWVFPDRGGDGYYRWQVDGGQMAALLADIDALEGREKIALLSNSRALLDAGRASVAEHFRVLEAIAADPNPIVFREVLEQVKDIGENLIDAQTLPAFGRYVDRLMVPWFERIGGQNRPTDSEAVIRLRPRLLRALGQFSDSRDALAAAASITERFLAEPAAVDKDLAVEALRVSAIHGDDALAARYLDAYRTSTDIAFRAAVLRSLYFTEQRSIRRILDFLLSDEVKPGDTLTPLFFLVYANKSHAPIYDWLDRHFDALVGKAPESARSVLPQYTGSSCDRDNLERTLEFYRDKDALYATALAKAEEDTRRCIALKQRQQQALRDFLDSYPAADAVGS